MFVYLYDYLVTMTTSVQKYIFSLAESALNSLTNPAPHIVSR